jgi:hypothetical protein
MSPPFQIGSQDDKGRSISLELDHLSLSPATGQLQVNPVPCFVVYESRRNKTVSSCLVFPAFAASTPLTAHGSAS